MSGILKDPFWRENDRRAENKRAIECAVGLASEVHQREWRKGKNGLPYMVHIYDIMKLARHVGIPISDGEVYQAIALHDVVESGCKIEHVKTLLPKIAPIIEELTFLGTKEEKPAYLASFGEKSVTALVVKAMDRLCNTWDFFKDGDARYAGKYLKMADSLFHAFSDRCREITERFGEGVYFGILEDYQSIMNQIENHP